MGKKVKLTINKNYGFKNNIFYVEGSHSLQKLKNNWYATNEDVTVAQLKELKIHLIVKQ